MAPEEVDRKVEILGMLEQERHWITRRLEMLDAFVEFVNHADGRHAHQIYQFFMERE